MNAVRTETPIRSARRWALALQRGDDPDREDLVAREQEAGPSADDDRVARAADRLDQLGQVVEVRLLRGVVLLAQRQDPVLDDAGGQLVEGLAPPRR